MVVVVVVMVTVVVVVVVTVVVMVVVWCRGGDVEWPHWLPTLPALAPAQARPALHSPRRQEGCGHPLARTAHNGGRDGATPPQLTATSPPWPTAA